MADVYFVWVYFVTVIAFTQTNNLNSKQVTPCACAMNAI